ncbi:hypothetical protein [Methyloversatilis thermotolerans]|uniref:hypothetical protein n=1 Tax=Methyloversatilis thermotolerans TaxID=1346290 RepID=UPI0003755F84|nr:hypothetical protein [Methyloversatilis thermotolerans]
MTAAMDLRPGPPKGLPQPDKQWHKDNDERVKDSIRDYATPMEYSRNDLGAGVVIRLTALYLLMARALIYLDACLVCVPRSRARMVSPAPVRIT